MTTTPDQGALFDEPIASALSPGRAERGLRRAIEAATHLDGIDAGLIAGAMVAARALDAADRAGGTKGGYLVAQLLRPYQDALAGLRLPAAVEPAGGGQGVPAPGVPDDVASLLGDAFGPS